MNMSAKSDIYISDETRRTNSPEVPWRIEDVMAWTGMSRRYLLDLARQGLMPGRKIGGTWFFSRKKLARFFGVEE